MAESDSNSAVSVVAIIAIIILVGGGLYFLWATQLRNDSADIEIDVEGVPLIDDTGGILLHMSNTLC